MRAGFLQRCENSLRQTSPEMMHFQAWNFFFNQYHVVAFDPIKIWTPQNDRLDLTFVKYFPKVGKIWPKIVKNWPFMSQNVSEFFLPKLKKTGTRKICVLCCSFWSNWAFELFSTSKWSSTLKFCEIYKCSGQKNDQKWSWSGQTQRLSFLNWLRLYNKKLSDPKSSSKTWFNHSSFINCYQMGLEYLSKMLKKIPLLYPKTIDYTFQNFSWSNVWIPIHKIIYSILVQIVL